MASIASLLPFAVQMRGNRRSLADELRAAGVPVLPRRRVWLHRQQAHIRKCGVIGYGFDVAMTPLNLIPRRLEVPALLGTLAAFSGFNILVMLGPILSMADIPPNVMIALGILAYPMFIGCFSEWFGIRYAEWWRTSVSQFSGYMPRHLRNRIQQAEGTGASVWVEELGTDPLLVATRPRRGWHGIFGDEVVCIGAWGTGTALDDV